MFDLNGFKAYNDRYGHLAGDEALRAFGRVLITETRAMNLAARYGGDEFLTLLADSDLYGAEIFVQRVKDGFREAMSSATAVQLSIEAGMAEYTKDMKAPDDLVHAADQALYESKASRSSR
jgi:diguanylate cyclase (GGDEF)-like protein